MTFHWTFPTPFTPSPLLISVLPASGCVYEFGVVLFHSDFSLVRTHRGHAGELYASPARDYGPSGAVRMNVLYLQTLGLLLLSPPFFHRTV